MKKIFYILVFFILWNRLFSEKITINFQDGKFLKEKNLLKIMENRYGINLPSYLYILKDNGIKIKESFFSNPVEVKGYYLKTFSQKPLSILLSSDETTYKGEIKDYIIFLKTGNSVNFFPYFHKDGKLYSYTSITIEYEKRVFEKKDESVYDYLIITSLKYDTVFQRLKDWKIKKGYKTRISFIESIIPYYSGIDSAEKIRNFIKDQYNSNRFKYLLLGGDRAIIPVRRLYAMDCNADYYDDEDSIPADIYYSNLDGNFNLDGDQIWGEVEDSVDLVPEVIVGRILFDTIYYGPSPIVSRMIDYDQCKNIDHLSRGIFLGMILWNQPLTSGGISKDMIQNDIIPSSFHILKFYEDQGHIGKTDILDSFDIGYNIVNHNGHGSFKGIWVDSLTAITRGDATSMNNGSKTGLFYSIGCWVGAFDRDNTTYLLHSITENMQSSPTGGYISLITNSRYGWGAPGYSGYGISEVLDYRFFQILFNESIYKRPAEILNQVKEEIRPFGNDENLYRWHIYQLNYFGDPEISIFTEEPESLIINLKKDTDILELSAKNKNGLPVGNLNVSFSKNDSIIYRGITSPDGYMRVPLSGIVDSEYIYIVASKVNFITYFDSLKPSDLERKNIFIYSDSIFIGGKNYLKIQNEDNISHKIYLKSRFIEEVLNLNGKSIDSLIYIPVGSKDILDTFEIDVDDTYYDSIIMSSKKIDFVVESLYFSNSNLNLKIRNGSKRLVEGSTIRIVLDGTERYLDTTFISNLDSTCSFSFFCGVPTSQEYLKVSTYIYKFDTLIGNLNEYLNRGEYSFYDDFTTDLSKWETGSSNWIITDNSFLHAGSDYGYYNNMSDTIRTKEFYIYPQAVCSIYLYTRLPILEFYNSEPVFDVDGFFIRLLKQDSVKILDFISSGGALRKDSSLIVEGWKTYIFNEPYPQKAKIEFIFRSDSVIVDSGIYIKDVRVKPKFFFSETTGIVRTDTNIINRDNITYYFKGLTGIWRVKIISLDGRVVKDFIFENRNRFTFDLKNFSNGVYFVIFENDKIFFKDKLLLLR